MPLHVFQHIKRSASQFAYNSRFYNWSLSGRAPEHLLVKPVDPWPGSADNGQWICGGAFVLDGDQLHMTGNCWEPAGIDETWLNHVHGFSWLRDLRALGGDDARKQARLMIAHWAQQYRRWHETSWRCDRMGERIAMWITLYEFFGASAPDDFQDIFFDSLARQARHLSRAAPSNVQGLAALKAIKGLLYAGLALEGQEYWIAQALEQLDKETKTQILSDGSHISRSPKQLVHALQIYLDIRCALAAGGYPLPEFIQHAIDRMGPAVRFFRYADKGLGLFHGAQEGDTALIDTILTQANTRGKGLQSLPEGGFEKINLGRTCIIFDNNAPPPFPYDREAHAAPLAFEMTYGKDRLFISCGSHPSSDDWKDALRATAAHNTATIDNRNACEIREDGHFARRVRNTAPLREETKSACLLESSHDGYLSLHGLTHRRRLYLSDKGHDLRGEDVFTSAVDIGRPLDVAVRFHIHPGVLVSLVQNGQEALLRLPNGIGWRFHTGGGQIALEDSLYLGQGARPRKTKQLVIYGRLNAEAGCVSGSIKWGVKREG